MMKHTAPLAIATAAIFLAIVASPLGSAAQPAPTPTMVPMAKPDFSSMMFLTGTWNCTQMLRGKERPDTSTTSVDKNGMWMVTQDTAPPFDQYRTFTVNSMTYMTYDPTVKKWVQVGYDDSGGYYLASATGWDGNTIKWSATGLDGTTVTDVLTKESDTKTTDQNTVTDPQGKTTNSTITCTKSGG
jgi:hypothetical protein